MLCHGFVDSRWRTVRGLMGTFDDVDTDRSGSVSAVEVTESARACSDPFSEVQPIEFSDS